MCLYDIKELSEKKILTNVTIRIQTESGESSVHFLWNNSALATDTDKEEIKDNNK